MEKTANTAIGTKWVIDPVHSELLFSVKHMMISNVKGEFRNFSVSVEGDDIFTADIRATIDASSLNTNNPDRDAHLKSADFFDSNNHPEITFQGTSQEKKDDGQYELSGLLTIRGISKEVKLNMEFGGLNKDPWGNEKAGFSLAGKIKRSDWNLNWNAALEAGGVLVSDEVKLMGEVQLVKQVA